MHAMPAKGSLQTFAQFGQGQQSGLSTVFNLIDWPANDTLLIVILCYFLTFIVLAL